MTIRDFWEINLKGNVAAGLQKLSAAGNKAAASFLQGSKNLGLFAPQANKAKVSVASLEAKLTTLRAKQREAFDVSLIRRYNREIERTQAHIARLNNIGRGGFLGRFMGSAGRSMAPMMSMLLPFGLSGGLAFGAANMARSALVNHVMPFSQEMSRVKAITGANREDFVKLREQAIAVGGGTPFTATQAAAGERYLGMAGFKTKEIITALPTTANLAMAGDMGMDRSADILSNVLGQFQMEAFRSGDAANMIAATVTSSNTNIEQAASALKYLGPSAHALGIGLNETLSVIGALGDAGIQGSMAGRALGTSIVRMAKPTEQMQKSIDELGLKMFDARGEFVGMYKMLQQLEGATKSMTQEQKAMHLQTLFGAESFQEINILLAKGSEAFNDYTNSITDTNKLLEMASAMQDNLTGDLKKMNSAWEQLILTIENGEGAVSKFLRGITQDTTAFLNDASVREKFNVPHMPFFENGYNAARGDAFTRLVQNYQSLNQELFDSSSKGGSAEEQIARYEALKGRISKAFPLSAESNALGQKELTQETAATRIKMMSDLLGRVSDAIKSIEQQQGKPVATGPTLEEGGEAAAAADAINGGGKKVRNVIVNIGSLVENLTNYMQGSEPGKAGDMEEKIIEVLLRAVRGSEEMLIQGDY